MSRETYISLPRGITPQNGIDSGEFVQCLSLHHSTKQEKCFRRREAGSLPYKGWVVIQPVKFQFEHLPYSNLDS